MNEKEFNFLKENYLSKDLNLNFLMEMVGNVLNEKVDVAKATVTPDEDIDISLPVLRISEAWGRKGNDDRQVIESFTKKIQGETLEAKLTNINQILTGEGGVADVSELLSAMVVTEVLSTILADFTESAGGFIFEGFLAGLFGGESIQITSPEEIEGMDASGKPITDVILGGRHYSLKLLGQTTGVKGSFANMVAHFKKLDHVVYLDARRVGKTEGLQFGEFTITLENFLDIFVTPFLSQVWKKEKDAPVADAAEFKQLLASLYEQGVGIKELRFGAGGILPSKPKEKIFLFSPKAGEEWESSSEEPLTEAVRYTGSALKQFVQYILNMPDEQLQQFAGETGFVIHYAESKFENTKAEKLFGSMARVDIIRRNIEKFKQTGDKTELIKSLEEAPGVVGNEQFEFTRLQAEEKIKNFKHVGTLMIGEKTMKTVWLKYAKVLQEVINPIYSNLQEFTNNVNAYLLGVGEGDRKTRGMQAINDAKQLATATDKAIKIVTPEENI
jgi:hypothetical protein